MNEACASTPLTPFQNSFLYSPLDLKIRCRAIKMHFLDRVISEIKIISLGTCDVIAIWRHQWDTFSVNGSWLIFSLFPMNDRWAQSSGTLERWQLASLTLLAKTNAVMSLDYSMKFKSLQNHNQEWINIIYLYISLSAHP